MHGIVKLDVSKYVKFSQGRSRRGVTGIFLETQYARTSCYRDTYFIRKHLRDFFFSRLQTVFDGNNVRPYKLTLGRILWNQK